MNQDSLDGMEKNGRKNSVKSDLGSKRRTQRIGEQLRRVYDEVAQEDVPDEFLRLLEEADRARPSSTSDKS
ncbi:MULTISPECIES: NepR family anti-sigma factor [unclassified Hyphomonas]|uniref:NepR family anti-sigma factor n=1 Tax=unclassified Hyphomonas TaxID=2630699 RepID=UPI0025C66219|nr:MULTISPECIES: NepR family anti-sigma factor [unclassified Hyphomonas]